MNYNEQKTVIDVSDAVNISDLGIKITNIIDSCNSKDLYLKLGNIDLKQSQLLGIKALVEVMQSKIVGIETASAMTEASANGLGIPVKKPEPTEASAQTFSGTFSTQAEEEKPAQTFSESFSTQTSESNTTSSDELSSFAQLKKLNSVGDFVTDSENLQEVESENLAEETQEFVENAQKEDAEEEEQESQNIYETLDRENNTISAPESIESALDATFGASPEQPETSETEEDVFAPITMHEKMNEITETTEVDEGKYVLLDTEGITPEGLELIKSNTSDLETLYLTQTLRSGQTVSFEGNIFLIGDAHPGSEINASGDITVWGILGGIVHAGSKGNTDAKVRALKLNPIQLRIANLYSRRNDTVNVPYVQKSNEFTPEEARIENNQIVIYKTLRRED